MKTKITNGYILSDTLRKGELCIENDRIIFSGEHYEGSYDKLIDAHGGLVMPGFCNAHTHSAMTFLRSCADDMPLDRWLNEQIFPREAKLTGDDIYHLSRLAVMEYLTSGITSCFDMYFYPDDFVSAMTDCGFRAVLCGAVNDFSESVEKLEDYYNRFNGKDPLISYKLGFHAEYTTSENILKDIAQLAEKYHAPVYAHSSETASEVEGCIQRHGMTPTAYFESVGLYNYGGGGFHCVYMTDEDMEIYKNRGLFAVTNPSSNAKLASGIAPLCEMHERGIGIAVGTDGPASNNALDMFREMYLAVVLQKLRTGDASAMPAAAVLEAALSGGARAMGIDSGRLEAGRLADIVIIDLNMPNMQPVNNIVNNLVYSGSKSNVALTMVGGRVLYERGQFFINDEPERIYAKANEIIRRISSQV
ncbi:MAG: amidohydrolase [Oscillospiraceae bacterium]|nr:amidohydrolase [Oscillospiraceae bacterium]